MKALNAADRPSMADVARMSKVSTQTVSRYFTGTGYVGAETRARIASVVSELGYVPNQAARNLRAKRTNTVGVLAMGNLDYGSASVLSGLGRAARESDVTLTITQLDLDFEAKNWELEAQRALDHFISVQVEGIIMLTSIPNADRVLSGVSREIPVFTGSELPISQEASGGVHSYSAALDATRYLVGLGHRKIAHIAGPVTRNEAAERVRGYRDAMTEAGLVPQILEGATDWSAASGYTAGESTEAASFTGVIAANDEIALGFMSAMENRGARAPNDFSIVGIDDMPEAAYFSPPLTTMRLDFQTLGVSIFRMLHHQIQTGEHAHHIVLEPELVVRSSTKALVAAEAR